MQVRDYHWRADSTVQLMPRPDVADQIVRTDLKELVDLDLQGRVYGYAPMGDDREDMEGFRFWKTGMFPRSDIQLLNTDPSVH